MRAQAFGRFHITRDLPFQKVPSSPIEMLAAPCSLFTSVQTSAHFEQKTAEETEQCMDGKWNRMRMPRLERDGIFLVLTNGMLQT